MHRAEDGTNRVAHNGSEIGRNLLSRIEEDEGLHLWALMQGLQGSAQIIALPTRGAHNATAGMPIFVVLVVSRGRASLDRKQLNGDPRICSRKWEKTHYILPLLRLTCGPNQHQIVDNHPHRIALLDH